MPEPIVIGIDIAKQTCDAAIGVAGSIQTVANDDSHHAALIAALAGHSRELIVREATEGLERDLAGALQATGFAVAIINLRQARDFAKTLGSLAKTDRIEAKALADLAQVLSHHPERDRVISAWPTPEPQALQALVARRRQFVTMLVAER